MVVSVSPRLTWYWHRFRAMSAGELAEHLKKKVRQFQDHHFPPDFSMHTSGLSPAGCFPRLPDRESAPEALVERLRRDSEAIRGGHWRAFGHMPIQVGDPPRWHKDYQAREDLTTGRSAFQLDHRRLPRGCDIKLIWEPSRWHALVRLGQAAYLLGDEEAEQTCRRWLSDWVEQNPPYYGWNWTSALEGGIRLIQFTWMDALLDAAGSGSGRSGSVTESLEALRRAILPPHVWFVWRHRSFGSSANNHLLGELTGLIVALARWPALERWAVSLDEIQRRWEDEVLAQFAPDGGNREQALNYHLFSWEFCWQAQAALLAAGRTISSSVNQRLRRAVEFFLAVQIPEEPWDFGDSDNGYVTPFVIEENRTTQEWYRWFQSSKSSPALHYWWGPSLTLPEKPQPARTKEGWRIFPDSGIAVRRRGEWILRWDLSPLGYLSTAAHGHLDLLHLSIWYRGAAMVIDPGTAVYYANPALRRHLASWEAHNGPRPAGIDFPKRLGSFLWSAHHPVPELDPSSEALRTARVRLAMGYLERTITERSDGNGWDIADAFEPVTEGTERTFTVCWQFPPGARLERVQQRRFILRYRGQQLTVETDTHWAAVDFYSPPLSATTGDGQSTYFGVCSPAFRSTALGPYIRLTARRHNPCLFRTTFLASDKS